MQSIGKLTELRQLYAGGCLGITTAGIAAITNLHRLELLAIPGNPVTDEAFSYLEQLPSLRELRIADTRISKNSRKAFLVKRPQIKILTN